MIAASPARPDRDSHPSVTDSISLQVLGQHIGIRYDAPSLRDCLSANFAAMASPNAVGTPNPDLDYSISVDGPSFVLERSGRLVASATGLADLIHYLEKDLIVNLQQRRADLFFLHSAAVEWRGKAILLAADAGSGKSTTTWGLMHHGVGYLSDELSPIDLRTMEVFAYPHALCLKTAPPHPYPLPSGAMHLGRTTHIPVQALPGPLGRQPLPLGAVFLIKHDPQLAEPTVRPLRAAEASARLYVTALNALAHDERGLTAVMRIAASVPRFEIRTAGLTETCHLILSAVDQAETCSSSSC